MRGTAASDTRQRAKSGKIDKAGPALRVPLSTRAQGDYGFQLSTSTGLALILWLSIVYRAADNRRHGPCCL